MSRYSKGSQGFTLLELLVSISIVTIMLTIIVLNQSRYTDGVTLSNLADEIGLSISQAQAYGVGVKEITPGSSEFSASYGLAFSLIDSNKAYVSFADRNGDNVYGGDWSCPLGGSSECLGKVDISRGNYIESLCLVREQGADNCQIGRVDISFVRPSTEARVIFFNGNGQVIGDNNMKGARITIKSPLGSTRMVAVYTTGQVSVQ